MTRSPHWRNSPLIALLAVPALAQGPRSLGGVLPDEVVLAVEVAAPPVAIAQLRLGLGSLPDNLPAHVKVPVWLGLLGIWVAVQGSPEAWAERMAGGGAIIGWLPGGAGLQPCAVLRPTSIAAARQWLERFSGDVAADVVDDLLVLSGDATLTARLASRVRERPGRWGAVDFGTEAAVRGAIDLAALRRLAGPAAGNLDSLDAGARFFLAPIVHPLANAPWLRFSITGGERLTVTAEADVSVRATPLGSLLPAPGERCAVPLAADGLGMLRLDRSVRTLLTTPERFLKPAEVLTVQSFLSIADAIDGPRSSFVDDLLGGLGEPFELHVLPVEPLDVQSRPRLQLPGFAVVAPLLDPAAETVLFRAAQFFALIVNAERGQKRLPLFTLRAQRTEGGHGLVAEPGPWRGPGAPPLDQALSPTLWSERGVVVLASTHAAAMAVVARVEPTGALPGGDRLVLRGPALAKAIAASRSALELARVLDEGEDPVAASRFYDVLVAVLNAVGEVTAQVECDAVRTRLLLTMERTQ